jgi:uncharacterized protein related to proFAR isomerase
MILFPAIDLYDRKAVRLYKGDYNQMTVYSENPIEIAWDFSSCGATHIHMVDLEGAKDGTTPNLSIVEQIAKETGMGEGAVLKAVRKLISKHQHRRYPQLLQMERAEQKKLAAL